MTLNPGAKLGPYAGRESERNQNLTATFFENLQ